jgi:hypothetical protein
MTTMMMDDIFHMVNIVTLQHVFTSMTYSFIQGLKI